MNKKFFLLCLVCCVIAIIGILIAIFIKNTNSQNSYQVADGMTRVDLKSDVTFFEINLENAKVYENYNEFSSYFNSSTITSSDFNNNNYAIITLNYDECGYTNVIPTEYNLVGNSINVIAYHDDCSSCAPMYAYYAVKIDKSITKLKMNINWFARNGKNCK